MRTLWIPLLVLLAGCGPLAPPARPTRLTTATKPAADLDRFVRAEALRDSVIKGQDAVPALVKALDDKEPLIRAAAIETLGHLGPKAREAVPRLLPQLDQEGSDPAVVNALVKIGPTGVPAITTALQDEHATVRAGAAEALGGIGPPASAAAPALVGALDDKSPKVRRAAAEALGRIGAMNDEVRQALTKKLMDEAEPVRFHAAEALIRLDPKQEATLAALVKGLENMDVVTRARAATALGKLGPAGKAAWTPLTKTLTSDENPVVRGLAGKALSRIDPPAAVPLLITALRDPEVSVRNAAAEALGDLGPAAKEAIPALTEAMKPLNGREAAYQAIKKIEAAPPMTND